MITRFYVDNYKCLVNFEYKPKPMELIIGDNGSGKTTVFEALDKVRGFLNERIDARKVFTPKSSNKASSNPIQTFEVDFENNGVEYQYRLEILLSSLDFRVEREVLKVNKVVAMESAWKEVEGKSYPEDEDPFGEHAGQVRVIERNKIEEVMTDPNISMAISSFSPQYKRLLNQELFIKLNPPLVGPQIGKIAPRLFLTGSNFASYYIYALQQKQGKMFDVIAQLREVLPGFDSFSVEEDFEEGKRELNVIFRQINESNGKRGGEIKFSFDELSDGQRALIVLYTLVYCALDAGSTLIIDEPENYIGLKELQPLILLMEERVRETGGQILLISHNQEFINMLTDRGQCMRFYRENNGHTRIAPFNPDSELTAAEIVASGMEADE